MSKYASLWLGAEEDGPAPTFRDDSPDGVQTSKGACVAWPQDAVMAVEFTPERFPNYAEARASTLGVRFFGSDGWPLGLPIARTARLSTRLRLDFQVEPIDWANLSRAAWRRLEEDPLELTRGRAVVALLGGLATSLPPPECHR
jgi:hypothetical protein